jgi:hypothetical protein
MQKHASAELELQNTMALVMVKNIAKPPTTRPLLLH